MKGRKSGGVVTIPARARLGDEPSALHRVRTNGGAIWGQFSFLQPRKY